MYDLGTTVIDVQSRISVAINLKESLPLLRKVGNGFDTHGDDSLKL